MLNHLGRFATVLLTHDFCPWANRWVHWTKHPYAILGLATVVALACALFVKPVSAVACGAALLILLLGHLWPGITIRGLTGELRFQHLRATEGDNVQARFRIVNRWPWPVWGITIEGGNGVDESVALARVAGWSAIEFDRVYVPQCRGEFPQVPLRLTTGFPFGLRYASRPVIAEDLLLVWPKIIPLETLLDAAETRPSEDQFSEIRLGDSGDLAGTRLFRSGDSLRRVHWAQTARLGKMIVCERQASTQSAIRVVFDSNPLLHRGAGGDSTMEWSIRIAASVCSAYHRENAQVECCFGHETIPISAGVQGWRRFLDRLARWKPCEGQHEGRADHAHGCEHEHPENHCQRIHHRNCGVFQLTITTDLGLSHRTEHRHVHGDHRLVLLRTAAFGEACDLCGAEHQPPGRAAIVIDSAVDIANNFRRQWRQACHAG